MEKVSFQRIQSPSSINTYRQCPRKYYYQYIAELETRPNIYLVRGKIAHSVLEDFFKLDIGGISSENFDFEFKIILHELLGRHWKDSEEQLSSLGLSDTDARFYLDETKQMIQFWLIDFLRKLKSEMAVMPLGDAFRKLTPITEEHFISEKFGVQGYIDAIFEDKEKGEVRLVDYKTSSRNHLSEAYRLQLAIYALLYHEKNNRLPDKVGIHFLRFSERFVDVDDELLEFARCECESIHRKTVSRDIKDYPLSRSGLCKWRSGECDFYSECNKKEEKD